MQERSAVAVGSLAALLLLLPLGYLFHVSPRFPGSLTGSLFGIAGALLMLFPLLYVVVKRIPAIKSRVTRQVSMRTLLALHVYAGVLGPILGLIHAAHKFRSPLGVSLTGMLLVVVVTGYVGRYLLSRITKAVQGERADLASLAAAFERVSSAGVPAAPGLGGPAAWLRRVFFAPEEIPVSAGKREGLIELADAMADVESAIRSEEVTRDLFDRWLPLHILVAILLYGLLTLHVWSGLYYGLRWLQ
ncbi:hypothetical protein [Methylobacterium isbiliense]|uniref:Iron reductase n=1 Tax=Methylobacterium isbiliense TaxID=315478 RepID=A0ABQ4SNW2_9HYPH|nr:hypothetical protein [Methylobacterium isbiliense]MDN3625832.1 hypothetical protein [Methylobacterium isbiliense]GJE04123.1 hypothetical protein GMJLKIPL_6084 [Methylobacterium isbiliense]